MNNKGIIKGCEQLASICNYRCCDHNIDYLDQPAKPIDSILLYPGEWEGVSADRKKHLIIVNEDFHGGKLAYCNRHCFDQSKCDPENNFKPLDCFTYPLLPQFVDNQLQFAKDFLRCPLTARPERLVEHEQSIAPIWELLTQYNQRISTWMKALSLKGYTR